MTPRPRRSWYAIAPARRLETQPLRRALLGGQVEITPGPEPAVRLDGRPLDSQVCDKVLYAWYDPDGGPPAFDLPRLDYAGWTRSSYMRFECVGQPVSVMRDLADYQHFETIHGYHSARRRRPFWTDGDTCGMDLDFMWPILGHKAWSATPARFTNRCVGLGYQLSDVRSMRDRFRTRHRVLPTPIDAGRMQVVLGVEVRLDVPLLGRLLAPLLHLFTRVVFRRDVGHDQRLWAQLPSPEGDAGQAPLDAFWAWADTFASDSDRRASP